MQRENKNVVINNNVILNLFQDLNRFVKQNKVEMLKQVQHDNRIGQRGFTLIELLVVVLIIGILAAVAVPQYQKAVLKARYTQLMAFGNAIEKAAVAYHLANGVYPGTFEELSLDLPGTEQVIQSGKHEKRTYRDYACEIYAGLSDRSDGIYCYLTTPNGKLGYITSYGRWSCMANYNWSLGNKICANFTGKTQRTGEYGDFANYPESYMNKYAF